MCIYIYIYIYTYPLRIEASSVAKHRTLRISRGDRTETCPDFQRTAIRARPLTLGSQKVLLSRGGGLIIHRSMLASSGFMLFDPYPF